MLKDPQVIELQRIAYMAEVDFLISTMKLDHIEEKIWEGFINKQSDREVAEWLGLSVTEIRSKRQNLYSKIGYQVAEDYRRAKNRERLLGRKEDDGQEDGEADENMDRPGERE